jgi:CDP-diacylglycerol--glycerol-3-phosphate 3-phosphatidyltransferase
MNLPNKITLSRIFIVPLFMVFIVPFPEVSLTNTWFEALIPTLEKTNIFMDKYGNYLAALIFILAASTDGIDGYIARKRKEITTFGIFVDPIADKLLVTAALVGLLQKNLISGWVVMILLAREYIVMGLRLVAAAEGTVIKASKLGKLKTLAQIIAITLIITNNFPFNYLIRFDISAVFMFIALVITVYSGFDYVKKNKKIIENR